MENIHAKNIYSPFGLIVIQFTGGMWFLLVCQASQAWMEWLMKKRKAFDQRGDMAIAAWAEQQQRELNLRARRLSRSKVLFWLKCPDEINQATKRVHKRL